MRDPQIIEREIDEARMDLEASLEELKEVARDRLDVKKRARELADRGKQKAKALSVQARARAKEHPGVVAAVVGGLVGFVALGIFLSRRSRAELVVSAATLGRLRDELG